MRLFLAAVTSDSLQMLLCFLFHLKHEADIKIPTCLSFPSASSFPPHRICFPLPYLLLIPLLFFIFHLWTQPRWPNTLMIYLCWGTHLPVCPYSTLSNSHTWTHKNTHTFTLVSCLVLLSVKLYVTVMLNGTSSLLLWWAGICMWQSLWAQRAYTHILSSVVSHWDDSISPG